MRRQWYKDEIKYYIYLYHIAIFCNKCLLTSFFNTVIFKSNCTEKRIIFGKISHNIFAYLEIFIQCPLYYYVMYIELYLILHSRGIKDITHNISCVHVLRNKLFNKCLLSENSILCVCNYSKFIACKPRATSIGFCFTHFFFFLSFFFLNCLTVYHNGLYCTVLATRAWNDSMNFSHNEDFHYNV